MHPRYGGPFCCFPTCSEIYCRESRDRLGSNRKAGTAARWWSTPMLRPLMPITTRRTRTITIIIIDTWGRLHVRSHVNSPHCTCTLERSCSQTTHDAGKPLTLTRLPLYGFNVARESSTLRRMECAVAHACSCLRGVEWSQSWSRVEPAHSQARRVRG